ncbi:MAG: hypothetical protein JOZ72_03220 [Alphaproteobacteria bacterium]|nr:hypothetical protein [Alphaproteobacteria bacterium]
MKSLTTAAAALGLLAISATAGAAAGGMRYSPAPPPEKLVAITSNLGTLYPKGVYYSPVGAVISGPQNASGLAQRAMAVSFKVLADHTLTKIQVPILYVKGAPQVEIDLLTDNGGLPATALRTWNVANVTNQGCCDVVTVTDTQGILLHAGQTYWVAASASQDTELRWSGNSTNVVDYDREAEYCSSDQGGSSCGSFNDHWTGFPTKPGLALGVFGPD